MFGGLGCHTGQNHHFAFQCTQVFVELKARHGGESGRDRVGCLQVHEEWGSSGPFRPIQLARGNGNWPGLDVNLPLDEKDEDEESGSEGKGPRSMSLATIIYIGE